MKKDVLIPQNRLSGRYTGACTDDSVG